MKTNRISFALAMASLSGMLFSGCATGDKPAAPPYYVIQPPSVIYVSDFYIDPAAIQNESVMDNNRGPLRQRLAELRGDTPEAKAHKLVRALSDSIVSGLKDAGLKAEALPNSNDGLRAEFIPANANLPSQGWIVGGWFTKVDEGNRAMQATVGFGMGAEQVDVQVSVSDLAKDVHEPFLIIGSQTGKNVMPGGLIARNPYVMAAKFVLAKGSTERDVKKQGAQIAKDLVQYLETGTNPVQLPPAK